MKKYSIGITDDHLLFAEGISNMIANRADLNLRFVAATVPEMLSFLAQDPVDFLLLDVNLPPFNGLEVLTQLKQEYPEMKIMILSMYQPADIALDLMTFKGDA